MKKLGAFLPAPGHAGPRDRPGTFSPRLLPKYARRTGASEGRLVITPSQWSCRMSG
ncbi:hypothetical protein ACFY3M_51855 [Streptomyces mirabilis]|uniref:hypothetical protein n=1 Tax=Streptomyces mirabilis TaxID=68239 RepID=UPI0036CDAC9E